VISAGGVGITGATLSFTVIVCETEVSFPQASVKVHVLIIVEEFPHDPGVTASTPATVIGAEQLSVAVNETIGGTSDIQETVTSAGAAGATGAVVSFTVNVADVVAVFPQASVAVNTTVTAVEQSADNVLKLFVHVTDEQVSVAAAPPFEASHAAIAPLFPEPSHSTAMLEAFVVITGGVTS
jgi:hypothetical protein